MEKWVRFHKKVKKTLWIRERIHSKSDFIRSKDGHTAVRDPLIHLVDKQKNSLHVVWRLQEILREFWPNYCRPKKLSLSIARNGNGRLLLGLTANKLLKPTFKRKKCSPYHRSWIGVLKNQVFLYTRNEREMVSSDKWSYLKEVCKQHRSRSDTAL